MLTATALIGALTAGCAGGGAGAASRDPNAPLEVWSRSDPISAEVYKKIFAAFTKQTGIKVDYQAVQDFDKVLMSRAASKDLPDIGVNDMANLGYYQSQGLLRPVDKNAVPDADQISAKAWASTKGLDGKYYGIPFSRQTMGILIRTDWLRKLDLPVPTTWSQLLTTAKDFTYKDPDGDGKNDTYGMLVPGTATQGYAAWWAASFIWQGGGGILTQTGRNDYRVDVNTTATVNSVKWLQGMFCRSKVVQPGALTAATKDIYPFFQAGKVGISLTGPYQLGTMDQAPGKDKYTVIPTPAGPGGNRTVLAEGENVYEFAGSANKAAQAKLAAFLVSAQAQKIGMSGMKPVVRLPVNTTVDPAKVYKDPRWQIFADSYDHNGRTFPSAIDWQPVRLDTADALNALFTSCSPDVKGTLDTLATTVRQELQAQGVTAR